MDSESHTLKPLGVLVFQLVRVRVDFDPEKQEYIEESSWSLVGQFDNREQVSLPPDGQFATFEPGEHDADGLPATLELVERPISKQRRAPRPTIETVEVHEVS